MNRPSHQYQVGLARPGDLPRIAPIELAAARLLAGHAPEAVLEEVTTAEDLQAAQRHGRLWVALSNDVPVGFALVEMHEPDAAHLEEIDVHPDHGRRGLGTRLVRHVCRWAETQALDAVTLTTFRDVPWNLPFYTRLGFEEITPRALTPALREMLEAEARQGFDPGRRVAMRWRPGYFSFYRCAERRCRVASRSGRPLTPLKQITGRRSGQQQPVSTRRR